MLPAIMAVLASMKAVPRKAAAMEEVELVLWLPLALSEAATPPAAAAHRGVLLKIEEQKEETVGSLVFSIKSCDALDQEEAAPGAAAATAFRSCDNDDDRTAWRPRLDEEDTSIDLTIRLLMDNILVITMRRTYMEV
jgi:hypothetical protein